MRLSSFARAALTPGRLSSGASTAERGERSVCSVTGEDVMEKGLDTEDA